MLVYNVHSLIHLADDAKLFGSLENISCFPFENQMQRLKKMLRKNSQPLQQMIKRIKEKESALSAESGTTDMSDLDLKCSKQHDNGPLCSANRLFDCTQYAVLKNSLWSVTLNSSNNCIQLNDGRFGIVKNIVACEEKISVVMQQFLAMHDFFDYPAKSSIFDIYEVSDLSDELILVAGEEVKTKCVRLPLHDNAWLVLPLLHHM